MKLFFFLIAFCLVSIYYYFTVSGRHRTRNGVSESNLVIKSDHFYEEINYSGKFQLSEDETTFKNISPGGYFKFRLNDIRVKAESNLRGEIEYTIFDGQHDLPANGEGKSYIAKAIREMIAWGYDADARMERVYRRGGDSALLSEVDSMKPGNIKVLYLNHLLRSDSSRSDNLPVIIKKIASLGDDRDKVEILRKFSSHQLSDSATAGAYFLVVAGMGNDMDKANALEYIVGLDTSSVYQADEILILSRPMGSDMDRIALYHKMMVKGMIAGPRIDSLLTIAETMPSDVDKLTLYRELTTAKDISENQWISLFHQASQLESDMDKAEFLTEMASKMPKSEAIKGAYLKCAKTIRDDGDYGKVLRALE